MIIATDVVEWILATRHWRPLQLAAGSRLPSAIHRVLASARDTPHVSFIA